MTKYQSLLIAYTICTALSACATTGTTGTAGTTVGVQAGPAPIDPRGEIVRLLPPNASGWARIELARARMSPHWAAVTAVMTNEGVMEQIGRFEAHTGINALQSDRVALAVYPSQSEQSESVSVIVAQGGQTESNVRARWAEHQLSPREEHVGSLTVYHLGEDISVAFLASDVLAVFNSAVAARLARQMAGIESTNATQNTVYAPLWEQAGVPPTGLLVAAGDATSFHQFRDAREALSLPAMEQFVLRAELTSDQQLSVRAVGRARDAQTAAQTAAELEALRRSYGERFVIRLMGFGRLLNQGITAVSDGVYVRVSIDTANDEVARVIRAIHTAEALR
jgi:hypothetical protein